MPRIKTDFDTPWKEILNIYFKDFIAYCWPEKYLEIAWEKGYQMLDKELTKIVKNAPNGNHIVDKLIEVYSVNGQSIWLLIHLEIVRKVNSNFGERILVYRYRLRDLHQKPIASLAVLIDNNAQWRPTFYKEECWGTSLEIRFAIIKFIDYKTRVQELTLSTNPFAAVILAQLAATERATPQTRLINKVLLTKHLYIHGWQKKDILNLYRFIDWIIALPASLEIKYQAAIEQIEEELHVAYVTTAERIGIQKGEGMLLLQLLKHKFKVVPEDYSKKIQEASVETILKWGKRVLDTHILEEVFMD